MQVVTFIVLSVAVLPFMFSVKWERLLYWTVVERIVGEVEVMVQKKIQQNFEDLQRFGIRIGESHCPETKPIERIFLTIIIPPTHHISQQITHLREQISPKLPYSLTILTELLLPSSFPHELQDKLSSPTYYQQLSDQLHRSKSKQCRYVPSPCHEKVIYLMENSQEEEYFQNEDVLIAAAKDWESAVGVALGFEDFMHVKQPFQQYSKQYYQYSLCDLRRKVRFVKGTLSKYRYNLPQLSELESIKATLSTWTHQQTIPLELSLPEQDLFPTEYKLGVYLPLIIIFIMFPCCLHTR